MKRNMLEAAAVNIIIVLIIVTLAAFSDKSIAAFSDKADIYYKAPADDKAVALMINVYDGNEYVEKMLALFNEKDVKVTFFVGGCWAAKNTELVKSIFSNGHELGNHGYNHKLHTKLTSGQSRNEIMRTNSLIKEITGTRCTLFAPPSGDVNDSVAADAAYCGNNTVMWTADTIDWRDQDTEKIFSRVERNLCSGCFVLMHPTSATVEALPKIIDYIVSEGYEIKTVGQMINNNC